MSDFPPYQSLSSLPLFQEWLRSAPPAASADLASLRDPNGMTLLHCACVNDAIDLVPALISEYGRTCAVLPAAFHADGWCCHV